MAQLTEFGFERDNRTDVTTRLNNSFRNKFGANLLLTDDSIAGLLRSVIAERSLEFEKLLEDVYYSRTLNGAEGIALDDAASYFGFIRRGPQPSSGVAHIEFVDNGTNLGTNVVTTNTFAASNGLTYAVQSGGTLNTNITGAVIDVNQLSPGDYEFFITNTVNGGVSSDTFTLAGTDDPSIQAFALEIVSFVLNNTEGNIASVFEDAGIAYIGYASSEEFIGLTQPIYFESADLPTGFTYHSGYNVEATVAGFNTLEVDGITSFSNEFGGYVSATNTTDFNPGSENETDAEFRLRLQTAQLRTPAGTRDSLAEALDAVENVISYRIYDNPTPLDRPEADALTFNAVVRGGTSSDIANAIYDNKPLNVGTSGTRLFTVSTADGQTEDIFYSEAEESQYDLQITYVVNNTTPLSSRETSDIEDSITGLVSSQPIGLGVSNSQLSSAVLVALPAGRLLSVRVDVKRPSEGSSAFSQRDLELDFDQYATINSYTYVRTT